MTPGSAVRHAYVARHDTDCATRPGGPFMCMADDLLAERGHFICKGPFMCMADDLPAERGHFICKGPFMSMADDLPAERGHFICKGPFMCMEDDLPAERGHFICKGLFMCMTDELPAERGHSICKGNMQLGIGCGDFIPPEANKKTWARMVGTLPGYKKKKKKGCPI